MTSSQTLAMYLYLPTMPSLILIRLPKMSSAVVILVKPDTATPRDHPIRASVEKANPEHERDYPQNRHNAKRPAGKRDQTGGGEFHEIPECLLALALSPRFRRTSAPQLSVRCLLPRGGGVREFVRVERSGAKISNKRSHNDSTQMKLLILRLARLFGLFRIARRLTGKDLRILGYHGIWFLRGHFGNRLFMSAAEFDSRMKWLSKSPYKVLSLDQAIERISKGTLETQCVVVTIDDGWYGTYRYMLPALSGPLLPCRKICSTTSILPYRVCQ